MMLSASPSSLARSSLEVMLESLQRREEEENKPKDLPPALPARPTSKARLPSARRSLPNNLNFMVNGDPGETECLANGFHDASEETKRKDTVDLGHKINGSLGSKKLKRDVESPYALASDDNVTYFIKKKLHVWCRQPNRHWGLGKVQSTSREAASILLTNGNVMKVAISELLPANPDILKGVNDLMQLIYLNEPSVLHTLRFRYSQGMIYSKAGPILIALNPFKDVQSCGNDHATTYSQRCMTDPHVYTVANAAYSEMMRDKVNQSIIISGQSGSGKTETAKIALQYLAALGGGSCGIENKALQTHFILEAFGNAKTQRHNNSSRFGKSLEIHFTAAGKICGAKIQTFMLQKSRVVQLTSGERSYHIFYQLCAGSLPGLKEKLNLREACEYKYLNQSDCMTIDGVDDAKMFNNLLNALDVVQICKEDQELVFKTLAAILWLGNVSFQISDNENHVVVVDDEAVTSAAMLIGCSSQELMVTLSVCKVQDGKDTIARSSTLKQAIEKRDALAQFMYASLFGWLIEKINNSLGAGKRHTGRSINILDICGFESFKKNSFEQFCVNYADERLQQHFNRHIFKLEQESYAMDGVHWIKVDFEDNQECLDLFEKKPSGILSLLDEESNSPKATDLTFANKLKQHLNANPCFKGERGRAFGVRHFAGEVLYDTNGFLQQNKDLLSSDCIQLLASCSCRLLQLFSKMLSQTHKQLNSLQIGALDSQKLSVGAKLKGQLFELMHQLENSTPHFIHCIRPNTKRLPGIFDEDLVMQQLRCCGILEAVRLSRIGYPIQMTHQEFAERYGFLLLETNAVQDPLSISVAVLRQFNIPPEVYQFGYTKVHLRKGQIGALEDRRKQVMQGILQVQKWFRGHRARQYFHELKNGVTTLQSFAHGEIWRRKFGIVEKSSMTIDCKNFDEIEAIILLQSVIRGWLARRKNASGTHKMKKHLNNEKLQRYSRVKMLDMKEASREQVQNLPSALEELRRRVLKAEATLEQKEEENTALREQLKQNETKWIEYEAKMKSMEETWQKQMASLQVSLAAARKSLASDNTTAYPGRQEVMSPRYNDSEDFNSLISRTPGGSTPIKFSSSLSVSDSGAPGREVNGTLSAVSNLMREFEQRRQTFDYDARALLDVKAGQSAIMNPDEELRKLKHRFEGWKKEYKFRLRETKARLHKVGNSEGERSRRRWWGKLSSRAS
ncbi:myosin-2 isoform X2 [Neltuma alba]|uniref:myosin-2 isoform X2 n=1 Tax=Neltuma alba TaxID=207710 RepID=UPI0010A2DB0F|nr:myosin-2-like isoform X2 [Prosopis alba]